MSWVMTQSIASDLSISVAAGSQYTEKSLKNRLSRMTRRLLRSCSYSTEMRL